MSFLETPAFPDVLARGFTGGPEYSTEVVALSSGAEVRNANWSQPLRRYDAATAVRLLSDFVAVEQHFLAVGGRLNGWRLKDWGDYAATAASGVLAPRTDALAAVGTSGYGYGVPKYQLYKRYVRGALTHERKIVKPVSGTVSVTRGGSPVTFGAGAGNAAVDTATGVVTFVADATSAASSITPGATTQVILAANPGSLTSGKRLHLSGFTGADAAEVNGLSHAISSVTGSGPYTFTLSTNTSGKTISVGSGIGAAYPQSTEVLAAAFEFDVPVRFDTDRLDRTILVRVGVGGDFTVQASAIPVIELRL